MRPFERRATTAYPFFKIATWDARSMTWRDGRTAFATEALAAAQARKPGRYRISRVDEAGRTDLAPFQV